MMSRKECIEEIIKVFSDSGLTVVYNEDDVNLSDIITDSVTFMTILVDLEEAFGIEFPDEILEIDNFTSLFGLAETICEIKGQV